MLNIFTVLRRLRHLDIMIARKLALQTVYGQWDALLTAQTACSVLVTDRARPTGLEVRFPACNIHIIQRSSPPNRNGSVKVDFNVILNSASNATSDQVSQLLSDAKNVSGMSFVGVDAKGEVSVMPALEGWFTRRTTQAQAQARA